MQSFWHQRTVCIIVKSTVLAYGSGTAHVATLVNGVGRGVNLEDIY